MEMPDIVSWNSILGALADEGFIYATNLFFSEMRDLDLKPDEITVQGLIRACTSSTSFTQGQVILCS